jgi:hypothetical protein
MRNIRILVEFASVVMPGAVLVLILTYTFAPHLLHDSFVGTGLGIVAGLVSSFALGHLLQAFSQAALEPFIPRVRLGTAADQAFGRFAEGERYLTVEQIGLLESQFPARLGIPFPAASDGAAIRDSAMAHMEAYLYSAKVNERLDDLTADYKLNKGLFLSLFLGGLGLMATWHWLGSGLCLLSSLAALQRMEFHGRKFAQALFLQFLATAPSGREGGGKGEGAGGGMMPIGFPRMRGGGGGAAADDDAS